MFIPMHLFPCFIILRWFFHLSIFLPFIFSFCSTQSTLDCSSGNSQQHQVFTSCYCLEQPYSFVRNSQWFMSSLVQTPKNLHLRTWSFLEHILFLFTFHWIFIRMYFPWLPKKLFTSGYASFLFVWNRELIKIS